MPVRPRREFLQASLALAGLSALTGCSGLPFLSEQPAKIRRIGSLNEISAPPSGLPPDYEVLLQDLRTLGWVEGQNLVMDYRWADGVQARLPDLAADLIQANVDLVLTWTTPETLAARTASKTVPIIASGADFVLQGFAESLARPGGNVTGVSSMDIELNGKRVEMLKETVPSITRLAVVRNRQGFGNLMFDAHGRAIERGAQAAGLELLYIDVANVSELDGAFTDIMTAHPDAVYSSPSGFLWTMRNEIAALAMKHHLPTLGPAPDYAQAGFLLSYGTNGTDMRRRMAPYVDKILRGANPAEMPILRPSTFDLALNLKTAEALGLTMPPAILKQATLVIR